jgi:hypothetical protein
MADEAHRLIVDPVLPPRRRGVVAGRGVGQHDIEPQRLQLPQKLPDRAGPQDHRHVGVLNQRAQEVELEVARQRRQRTHADHLPRAGAPGERFHQFIARREGAVGAVEGDPARLGQGHAPSAAFEQGMAQPRLERLDLGRDGGLRHAEFLGRAGQIALRGDGAEGPQMGVVQKAHAFTILERCGEWDKKSSVSVPGRGRPKIPKQRTRHAESMGPRRMMVRAGGFEPPRPCGPRILSPICLPVPSRPRSDRAIPAAAGFQ